MRQHLRIDTNKKGEIVLTGHVDNVDITVGKGLDVVSGKFGKKRDTFLIMERGTLTVYENLTMGPILLGDFLHYWEERTPKWILELHDKLAKHHTFGTEATTGTLTPNYTFLCYDPNKRTRSSEGT